MPNFSSFSGYSSGVWQVITGASELLRDDIIAASTMLTDSDTRKALEAQGRDMEQWGLVNSHEQHGEGNISQSLSGENIAIKRKDARGYRGMQIFRTDPSNLDGGCFYKPTTSHMIVQSPVAPATVKKTYKY